MAQPDFTIADVLAWAKTKPADETYDVCNAVYCALAQFGLATGRPQLVGLTNPALTYPSLAGLDDALGFSDHSDLTFGGLAKRLAALLAEPVSDTWTKADAYTAETVSA
jgi:hypothetical protein